MGCKWVYLSVYGLLCQYLVHFVRYLSNIGAISVFTAVTGVYCTPYPPILKRGDLGCLLEKIFLKNIFFIFAFVIEVFKPVGVVSSFAGFFRVKRAYFRYFS